MLAREWQVASIGSNGYAFGHVTAETVMGSFKNSSAAGDSPIRRGAAAVKAEVDDLVVHWYKHAQLDSDGAERPLRH